MKQATAATTSSWSDRHDKGHLYLPKGVRDQATAKAANNGQSFSAYVAELIATDLETPAP